MCPLFYFKNCGGKYIILKNGAKDCSNCTYPHVRENYDKIINRLKRRMYGKTKNIKNTKKSKS
jgi:iron complex transport system ATP-binding protein